MHLWARYLILVLGLVVRHSYYSLLYHFQLTHRAQTCLHYILRLTQEGYSQATSLDSLTSHLKGNTKDAPDEEPETFHHLDTNSSFALLAKRRANATFVILARNSDLNGTVQSIYQIEERFNRKHRYPYVFLNDEPFTEEFKQYVLSYRPQVYHSDMAQTYLPNDKLPDGIWRNPQRTLESTGLDRRGKGEEV